jgi:transmembrane sensor
MDSNQAEIEAGEWLARLDREDASAKDLAAFDRWKEADPRHGAAHGRLAATWQALDRLQAIRPNTTEPIVDDYLRGMVHDSGRALQRSVEASLTNLRSHRLSQRVPIRQRVALAFAASVLVAIGGFWIVNGVGGSKTFRTSIGGFQRIVLEDQSTVYINTDSELRIALSPQFRKVDLVRGEASFEVAHDVSRPFIVAAGKTAVRAVGTKFDVRRLNDTVEVIVDEGKVVVGAPEILETSQVTVPATMPQVGAGQAALSSGNVVNLQVLSKGSIARKLAWQNQVLVFDGDSLAEVVAQFNRYNERQIVIADSTLAMLRIGGDFRPTNLDAFIDVLQSDFGVGVTKQDDRLILTKAGN